MKSDDWQPLAWLDDELAALDAEHLRRTLHERNGPQGPTIVVNGRTMINFGSNDYLGLAGDQRLVDAAVAAAREEGWGSGASPLVIGRSVRHAELESRLAEFEGAEAALVFPSGFAANQATIASLVGRGDVALGDQLNHASLIDGCRLSRADVQVYPHGDLAKLEELLRNAESYRRRLIVTDSLFSMDGDLAPLAELSALAQRYRAMLLVDEAHATGVFGLHGRGVAEFLQVDHAIAVRIGTLSKALGSSGGFVSGSRALVDWLANKARAYVFSTAPPAATCAAALAALDIVDREPDRRIGLLERAGGLRDNCASRGGASALARVRSFR